MGWQMTMLVYSGISSSLTNDIESRCCIVFAHLAQLHWFHPTHGEAETCAMCGRRGVSGCGR